MSAGYSTIDRHVGGAVKHFEELIDRRLAVLEDRDRDAPNRLRVVRQV